MARRRILLVEDDHFQRAAVIEALQDSMRRSGGIEVIWADSESKARNVVAEALRSGGVFDAYILDLMVPWSQNDDVPEPPTDEALAGGPLIGGFRIANLIKQSRDQLTRKDRPPGKSPIILYTLVDNKDVHAFNDPNEFCYSFVKGEVDDDVAGLTAIMQP